MILFNIFPSFIQDLGELMGSLSLMEKHTAGERSVRGLVYNLSLYSILNGLTQ